MIFNIIILFSSKNAPFRAFFHVKTGRFSSKIGHFQPFFCQNTPVSRSPVRLFWPPNWPPNWPPKKFLHFSRLFFRS
nr:MAG TPA: hypothetical protein [Caudoviricetes sp.]